MPKDRTSTGKTTGDREYVKQQMKAIKRAKKRGDEVEAQRLSNQLITWLGWDRDGF